MPLSIHILEPSTTTLSGDFTRYITDAEDAAIYSVATPRLQAIMDLLYLTGQRIGDVLSIRCADINQGGIAFAQQKTGARLLVRWSPDLREVVERARTLNGNLRALTLLHNRRGKTPDYSTTKIQWNKAGEKAGVKDVHITTCAPSHSQTRNNRDLTLRRWQDIPARP